ncbi:MAG: PDZ domain-containing protein [bacterium]
MRNGQELTIPVELGKLEDTDLETQGHHSETEGSLRGLQLQELTPAIKQSLGLDPNIEGVVISGVSSASQAEEAGLRRGDVVQEVNRQSVATIEEFTKAVRGVSGQPWLLLVNRGGNTLFVVVGTP